MIDNISEMIRYQFCTLNKCNLEVDSFVLYCSFIHIPV